jgi:hypothetical protein
MAHLDLDQLLNTLIPFAQQMLSKYGELFPFGFAMTANGKIEAHALNYRLKRMLPRLNPLGGL